MDSNKQQIIVREIEQWRRSKLLPEQYCDFLLNLYQDDKEKSVSSIMGLSTSKIINSSWRLWIPLFGGIGLIFYIILNFNSFGWLMQIAVWSLGLLICYTSGARLRTKHVPGSYLCLGLGSLLLLYMGQHLLLHYGYPREIAIGYMVGCGIIWMVTGLLARMPIFHFCGWIVIILIYTWFLHSNIDSFDWVGIQMAWLPISILMCWLGWLFHHRFKEAGAVLFSVGLIVWFIPEIYGVIITSLNQLNLQLSFLIKVILMGTLLYSLRKKWIKWVV